MNHYTVNGFERVSKARARRLFSADVTPIFACPCNLRPGGMWRPEVMLPTDTGASFDQLVNAATYYKCTPETGRYLAFYVAEGAISISPQVRHAAWCAQVDAEEAKRKEPGGEEEVPRF